MRMKSFVFFILFIASSQQAEWTYDAEHQWPGVCASGRQQSPIDLRSRSAVLDRLGAHVRGPLRLRGYRRVAATALNNGHTLKWSAVGGGGGAAGAPQLSGGPLRGAYSFLQLHLHWLSEHAIDGHKYPLEIHLVHVRTGLSLAEALQRPDGLAVIGVLCILKSDAEAEHALAQLMPALPALARRGDNTSLPEPLDLTRLLSPEPQSFYTYHGSLTTPRCQEAVTWIVMDRPLAIADSQYKEFSKIDIGGSSHNYRSLQPADRVVYRSAASCASLAAPLGPLGALGALGPLAALLACGAAPLLAAAKRGLCIIINLKTKLLGPILTKDCASLLN